jgi:hypothetical protein
MNPTEKPWKKLVGQVILGGEDFVSGIQELLDEKKENKEIPRTQRYSGRPLLLDLFSSPNREDKKKRNKIIPKAHFSYGYTLKEIGKCLEIHYSTVSRALTAE